MASIISASTTSGTALNMSADTTGVLQLATGATPTTAVTIDASQNVGIGTSSFAFSAAGRGDLEIAGSSTALVGLKGGSNQAYVYNDGTSVYVANNSASGNIVFQPANYTERMRIDSSGNLLMGTTSGGSGKLRVSATGDAFPTSYTSPSAGYFFSANSADTTCVEIYQGRYNKAGLALSANNSGTVTQVEFFQTGSSRGSISTNNSTTAYNTSSDYRLKENILPMTGALAIVQALKPVTYTWKQDGSDGQGFIAHELAEIVPDAVTGEKDAVETYTDEEGNEQTKIKPQGVDTSFLVATLTAAIQEQQTIINDLKARVTALEAK
jgi:hypothetical protein